MLRVVHLECVFARPTRAPYERWVQIEKRVRAIVLGHYLKPVPMLNLHRPQSLRYGGEHINDREPLRNRVGHPTPGSGNAVTPTSSKLAGKAHARQHIPSVCKFDISTILCSTGLILIVMIVRAASPTATPASS